MFPLDDTIAAIASPPGGAARGIVRLSGPAAFECLAVLFDDSDASPGTSARAKRDYIASLEFPCVVAASLRLPNLHSPLPCDVYLWCERSYTGQQVVEIHTLGSPPLLQTLLRALCVAGARLAEPGEFTLRAFLSGRIDLTQAEAVLGVIDAADQRDLQVALDQLAGGLAHPLHRVRDALLDLLAHVEAGFDFADEDVSFISRDELGIQLAAIEEQVSAIQQQMSSRGEASRTITAILTGRPNAGKSSLFNALARRRAALVSDQPGTTRDYLTVELDLGVVKCRLIDTAGTGRVASGEWRVASGECEQAPGKTPPDCDPGGDGASDITSAHTIESAAELHTANQRATADIVVHCLDSTDAIDDCKLREVETDASGSQIVVLTKCDDDAVNDHLPLRPTCATTIETSSKTGRGIDVLANALRAKAISSDRTHDEVVAGTAARCSESLRLAAQSLAQARRSTFAGQEELAAAEMRIALIELGKIVGAVYADDVLDRIFSRFCVGK